jgi:AraC-like DNA-binding protein
LQRSRDGPARPISYDIVGTLGLSRRYIQQLLEETGQSFTERLVERRLERAFAMLTDPRRLHLAIIDIALAAGFSDVSHFNRVFRRRFGDTPSGYGLRRSGRSRNDPATPQRTYAPCRHFRTHYCAADLRGSQCKQLHRGSLWQRISRVGHNCTDYRTPRDGVQISISRTELVTAARPETAAAAQPSSSANPFQLFD